MDIVFIMVEQVDHLIWTPVQFGELETMYVIEHYIMIVNYVHNLLESVWACSVANDSVVML